MHAPQRSFVRSLVVQIYMIHSVLLGPRTEEARRGIGRNFIALHTLHRSLVQAMVGYWSLVVLFVFALVVPNEGALYGYYNGTTTRGLLVIDPKTGASKTACDLSSLPPLSGGSSSSASMSSTLFFYTIDNAGNVSLVEVNPSTCKSTTLPVTGLSNGQNEVRDIKYNSVTGKLYMVFPNPFCLHGSLNQIDAKTGKVVAHLADVMDPEGLSQTAGVAGKGNSYLFVGVPIGLEDSLSYMLNKVDLVTGNASLVTLADNDLDLGDMWGSNYTLNVLDGSTSASASASSSAAAAAVFGAVSPSKTTEKKCTPSGFYTINSANGNVACVAGPVQYNVYPLAELASTSPYYYYQLFTDSNYNFYLTTYDPVGQIILSTVSCPGCAQISALNFLP